MWHEWHWELAQTVLYVYWVTWAFLARWWHTARWLGRRPHPALHAVVRLGRKLLWAVFGCWALIGVVQTWTSDDNHLTGVVLLADAICFWLLRQTWNDTRDMDDDDWLKRLIEKGQGVVQRVGNRLRVAVPAPSPA